MSVEVAYKVWVGVEEVSFRHGGDLGSGKHRDDLVAGEPWVLKLRHFSGSFPPNDDRTRCLCRRIVGVFGTDYGKSGC